jgi:hypothetical protein
MRSLPGPFIPARTNKFYAVGQKRFAGLYGFGGASPYYGYGHGSCYVLTPYGYAVSVAFSSRLGLQLKLGGVL